ncbi:Zinc finger protein jing [Folsomia candida]|uniref:Zinc finger protein jing n=1 Tax=Folsomia candida TaxID=158441 RepID=A0A226CVU6_FOLCA|nr:Zinc finger protein jing [Folsomia candida]
MPTTTTPGNNKKVFTMTIPTALQQLSSTLKKAKRKLAEAEKEDEPDVKILGVEVVSYRRLPLKPRPSWRTCLLGGRVAKSGHTSVSSKYSHPGRSRAEGGDCRYVSVEGLLCGEWGTICWSISRIICPYTVHVGSQSKGEVGFVCLWEGCKVFNRKSSSRSWLERHVLYHSGNKPFKCIFPGCGQSFGVQGALERHVNSHMASNCGGALSLAAANRNKIDANSPFKGVGRRKKQRCRKQRLNLGQHVDYFDKRVMELIKHRLASSISSHTTSAHHCTFRGQNSRRVGPLKEFHPEKTVPLTSLPKDKLPLVFPSLFPPNTSQRTKHAASGALPLPLPSTTVTTTRKTKTAMKRSQNTSVALTPTRRRTAVSSSSSSSPSLCSDEDGDEDGDDWHWTPSWTICSSPRCPLPASVVVTIERIQA